MGEDYSEEAREPWLSDLHTIMILRAY
jgi:hypothetical protein